MQVLIFLNHFRGSLNCLKQDDPQLLDTLRSDYLHPPSKEDYNLTMIPNNEPMSYSQVAQDTFLDKMVFKEKVKEGFFLEAGAIDFVTHSNTLWFEQKHGWTGALVEANPVIYPKG